MPISEDDPPRRVAVTNARSNHPDTYTIRVEEISSLLLR